MRLIALQKMFGIDSLEIRKFMREATGSKWRLGFLAATFGRNSARKLVRAMLTDDLIAKAGRKYELTDRGRALGMARAAQPLKRATADRLVWHFLRRVEQVNCDPNLLFWIDAVVVFGSYATTTLSVMSEIDLAVLYSKRVGPDLWTELADRRVEAARDSGRKFRSVSEKIRWPLKETELRLRKHHWALHLHDFGQEKEFIESVPHHLIFLRRGEIPEDLQEREPRRVALYKGTAVLVRAYANIANDLQEAGYSNAEIVRLKQEVNDALKLRDIIRQAAEETIDLKSYEADMRHLIDTYIQADAARQISDFGETGLVELIVKSGIADAVSKLPQGIRENPAAMAETIANNVRSTIVRDQLNDPAFYDKMSALLNEIIADLRAQRINYQEFLKRVAELAKKLVAGQEQDTPQQISTRGLRALYSNLGQDKELAIRIDEAVKKVRPADWRSTQAKRLVVKQALWNILKDADEVERIFRIIERHEEY